MFQGIEQAQMTRGGNWIQPGKFVLMVDYMKTVMNAVKRGEQFIAEFFVLYSTNPNQPAGSKVAWCASSWHPSAAGNIKAFFVSLLGIKPEQVTQPGCDMAVSPQQPMQGKLILAEAYNKKTQKTGNDFTAVNWGTADAAWTQRAAELVKTLGIALTPKDQINQPAPQQGFGGQQPYPQQGMQQPAPQQGWPAAPGGAPQMSVPSPQGWLQQPAPQAPQGFTPAGAPVGFGPPAGFPSPQGGFGQPQGGGSVPF